MTTTTTTADAAAAGISTTAPSVPFAGFWRRVGAFLIDVLLLGLVGMLLGWVAFDALVALGGWGRLVGFALAWPYFALMNSRVGGGQTLGKRLLGLRTVGMDGQPLSPIRGGLRAAVLAVPWFLNGAVVDPDLLRRLPLVMLLALLIFGLGLSLLYLLLFNRPSRRSLHDLLAGSVVVREALPAGELPGGPLWRWHGVVVGLLLLASSGAPVALQGALESEDGRQLIGLRATVVQQPGVRQAGVSKGWTSQISTQGSKSTSHFAVQAWADAPVKDEALCEQIARALLQTHAAELESVDQLVVTVVHGYDIGIASSWRSVQVALSLVQWRERLR